MALPGDFERLLNLFSRFIILLVIICLVMASGVVSGHADMNYNIFPEIPPVFLHFSDHPEKVTGRGMLYGGGIYRTGPTRFCYYHQGNPEIPELTLVLALFNNTSKNAELIMRYGKGGPDRNPFTAGHNSVTNYLRSRMDGHGQVMRLSPGETKIVFSQPLPPGDVTSGIIDMVVLSG
ncbi:MAG: hypothetical protein J7M18_05580, partial [Candidatus Eremiobacteraeota bacterium]|nr:hypothetical protein [Candidatus Eremiobacteraeota bacterium]